MTIKIKGTPKEITAFAVEMRQRKNKMPTVRIEDCVFRAISQNLQKAGCDSTSDKQQIQYRRTRMCAIDCT